MRDWALTMTRSGDHLGRLRSELALVFMLRLDDRLGMVGPQVKSAWLYKSGRTVGFHMAATVALEAC